MISDVTGKKRSRINTADIFFLVLFAAALAFLIYKCRFGFGNCDEAFYLTIPYRLYQGDSLFMNEWHLSQMSSVLLFPFVSLYMMLFKSTAGIIMFFRYLYLFLHGIVSVYIYSVLKKTSSFGAVAAALLFFIYAPFSINALSYNSLGISCLTVSCVLIYSAGENSKVKKILSGAFFAFSVLCCPYLVILFAVFTFAVIINSFLSKKSKSETVSFLTVKSWLYFMSGVLLIAAVFLVFILSRASVSEIINAMPHILNDPEHQSIGIFKKIQLYYRSIIKLTDNSSSLVYLIFFSLFAFSLFDRNKKENRLVYLIVYSFVSVSLFVIIENERDFINLTVFPLNILALGCYPLFKDNLKIRRMFYTVWLPGIIYSFCIHLSSNQLYLAIGSASAVSLVGSVVMIAVSFRTAVEENERPLRVFSSVVLSVVVAVQFYSLTSKRYKEVFWEDNIKVLTEQIDNGVEKGVRTTPYKKKEYEKVVAAKEFVDAEYPSAGSVLFFSEYTWPYLIFDNYRNSAYSAWLSGANEKSFERLSEYYRLNPEKIPDIIYIDEVNSNFADNFSAEYGYTSEMLDTGAVILSK